MASANRTKRQTRVTQGPLGAVSQTEMSSLLDEIPFLDDTAPAFTGGPVFTLTPTFAQQNTLRNIDARKDGAWKTIVDTSPGSSLLGQTATTAGVNFLGNQCSGNAKTDYAQIDYILPATYVPGAAITVKIRAKWTTTLLTVSSLVDCEVKVAADGTLGSDLVTTAAQQVTTGFVDYSFTVTPTGRVAGECLNIRFGLLGDDTGGTINTAGSISAIKVSLAAA